MSANTNPIFIAERILAGVELNNASGTTPVTLVTAGEDGTLIETISGTTTDTSAVGFCRI